MSVAVLGFGPERGVFGPYVSQTWSLPVKLAGKPRLSSIFF